MCWFIDKNRARAEIAEEALAESKEDLLASEDRLAKIISSAMDAIITLDQNQRIVVFNAAAEKVFCCSKWEALGRPIDRFIPERFRKSIVGIFVILTVRAPPPAPCNLREHCMECERMARSFR